MKVFKAAFLSCRYAQALSTVVVKKRVRMQKKFAAGQWCCISPGKKNTG